MRPLIEDAGATTRLLLRLAGPLPPQPRVMTYHDPLAARIAQLQERPGDGAALDEVEREIEVRRVHRRDYGYTGYVLRPR